MEPGVYRGLSFEAYLAIEAVNKSSLDFMGQTPAHFFANVLDPAREVRKATPAMELGVAIHSAILEPDKFVELYCCEPIGAPKRPTARQWEAKKPSPETLEAIEFWDNFETVNQGREVLSVSDWVTCQMVKDAVSKHPAGRMLLEVGDPEVVLVWRDPVEGVLCKGRVDWLTPGAIVDFKSTQDAGPEAFSKQVANRGWDVQAAWYADAYKTLTGEEVTFVFGAVEKTKPFACGFYYAGPDMLEVGRRTYRERLRKFAECKRNQYWPGYPEELTELKLPSWRMKQTEEG